MATPSPSSSPSSTQQSLDEKLQDEKKTLDFFLGLTSYRDALNDPSRRIQKTETALHAIKDLVEIFQRLFKTTNLEVIESNLVAFVLFHLISTDDGLVMDPAPQMLNEGCEAFKRDQGNKEEPFGSSIHALLRAFQTHRGSFLDEKDEYCLQIEKIAQSPDRKASQRIAAIQESTQSKLKPSLFGSGNEKEQEEDLLHGLTLGIVSDPEVLHWLERERPFGNESIHHLVVVEHAGLPKGRQRVLVARIGDAKPQDGLKNLDADKGFWIDASNEDSDFLTPEQLKDPRFVSKVLEARALAVSAIQNWLKNTLRMHVGSVSLQDAMKFGLRLPPETKDLKLVVRKKQKFLQVTDEKTNQKLYYDSEKDQWSA